MQNSVGCLRERQKNEGYDPVMKPSDVPGRFLLHPHLNLAPFLYRALEQAHSRRPELRLINRNELEGLTRCDEL